MRELLQNIKIKFMKVDEMYLSLSAWVICYWIRGVLSAAILPVDFFSASEPQLITMPNIF